MAASRWEYLRLAFLARPCSDRQIFRDIKRRKVRRIVELGMGSLERANQLIRVCQRYAGDELVSYAALDWFEERQPGLQPIKLIEAHRLLKASTAEVRLMPGGPVIGLTAVANALKETDLLMISPHASDAELESAWFYLPRMLAGNARVLRGIQDEEAGKNEIHWNEIDRSSIECLAKRPATSAAA